MYKIEFYSDIINRQLKSLNFSFNNISDIENKAFNQIFRLIELDLSHNQLQSFSHKTFDELNQMLAKLILKNNNLREFHLASIFPDLEYLDLSHNFIELFDKQISYGKLETVKISHNRLVKIKKEDFMTEINLVSLDLSHNWIESIDVEAFYDLSRLKELDLSHNKLRYIHNGTFNSLTNLKFLYLGSNLIQSINDKLFRNLFSLIDLDLSMNFIKKIETYSFKNLSYLENLSLYSFEHEKFLIDDENILTGLNSIKNIYLSYESNERDEEILVNSLHVRLERSVLGLLFYRSINLFSFKQKKEETNNHCSDILYLIKHKLHFNLKSDENVARFLISCQLEANQMFKDFLSARNLTIF